ncbi:MAG: glycosyltransferase family 1 protein [Gelidibacter sp.]
MIVNFFFRKRLSQNNSIEELFLGLIPFISKGCGVLISEVPNSGASPIVLIKNIWFARSKKSEINHITGDVHYLVLAFKRNSILTIHDVKSGLQGSFLKKFYIRLFWFWLPAILVKKITVISKFTKNELERIIPFAKNKINIIHNPVNSEFRQTPYQFNAEKPQILFIGTKQNKNLEKSFEAIKDLSCKAMIIGKLTEAQLKLLRTFRIDYESKFNLTFENIIESYKNCDLVCFASFYEGFGMPIIEAQATGRPVITSDFGAMKEVSNDSACLVNPNDVNSIREAILKICNDKAYRDQLVIDGLENVKRFQSDYIAKQYLQLYQEISD